MSIFLLVVGLILFIGLVLIHEWGHFIVARRNGVDVEEFGLGFPPRAFGQKTKGKKPFILSVNWLPLGGFVRLKGEHDADTGKGSFGAATLGVKTRIMAAGVVMNLLVAFILFTILAWVGMPQLVDHQFTVASDSKVLRNDVLIGSVLSGSPASKIDLQPRDKLVAIAPADQPNNKLIVSSAKNLPDVTKRLAGQRVIVIYDRGGQTLQDSTTLLTKKVVDDSKNTKNPKGYLGISPTDYTLQRSTWSAPVVSLGIMKQFTILTFQGLGTALKGLGSTIAGIVTGNQSERKQGQTQASSQVSGPVGIFVILKDGSALGPQLMLMIVAIISLTLAIMNILPIPALDGGKIFVTLVARLFHKRVSRDVEDWVYGTSFAFLLGLIVLITIVDVKRFF